MKVKSPVDLIVLALFFIVCSYIPSLIMSVLWHTCKGKKQPTYSPDSYRYNAQDIQDINMILQQIKVMQSDLASLKATVS